VTRSAALAVLLAASALAAAGCKKDPPPAPRPAAKPPAPPPAVKPKVEPPPPPLSVSQKIEIAGDFEEARKLASEALDHRRRGDELLRDKGAEAANDEYVKAKKGFQAAIKRTERWVEPELGQVSARQIEKDPELMAYAKERGAWVTEIANLGKLHQR
jgi:hypothetical protein